MLQVTIIGTGNVSKNLEKAFAKTKNVMETTVLKSRGNALSESLANTAVRKVEKSSNEDFHIYIIAVSDDAIQSVSQQLKNTNDLVVHTSGSVGINDLPKGLNRGVFYPLQTFSATREVDFKTVPICIEAENEASMAVLKKLAGFISDAVHEIDSEQRKALHLSAVFVNNFTNHLYGIGAEICAENNVPFDLLKPLIKETAEKIETLTPFEAQTGPAKRNDHQTIVKHLGLLKSTQHQEIYKILTESIKATYGKKL